MLSGSTERISDETRLKVLTGWKRLLPFYLHKTRKGWKLRIFPLQFFAWGVVTLLGSYLLGGTALYLNDRYRHNLEGISWVDRIYPANWPEYRLARGKSYIELAKSSLEQGDFHRAFHRLRSGVARAPADKDGRLLLAHMLSVAGRPDLAEETLVAGASFHLSDLSYYDQTVRTLFARQRDIQVIEFANTYIDNPGTAEAVQRLLAVSMANAFYYRGQFDQAEDILRTRKLLASPDGRLLAARIEWDRGFPDLAIALISQLNREFPKNLTVYRTYVQWLIEQNQTGTARRQSLMRRLSFPAQAQPRIDLLYAYDKSSEENSLEKELDSLFTDFGTQYPVVLQVGDFAANTGRPKLAQRVLSHAKNHALALEGPTLMLVESFIVAERYQEAIETARATLQENPEWEKALAPVFNGLQAIAFFALGDREEANLFLDSYLGLQQIRAENLVAVANRLARVGAQREARRVLSHAVQMDPLNQPALTRLIEFDLEATDAPDLPANLQQLLTMRRASPILLREAYSQLGQDRYLFVESRNEILDQLLVSLTGKSQPNTARGI
jgi:tetratricopeptide (TPR) repeat protein